jgi:tetratricopeptide (TPR) repeat protein
VGLGDEALARGDYDTAESRYRRVADQMPESTDARVGLGRVALARGEREAAASEFRRALEVDATLGVAWLGLADAEADDPTAARGHLERAVALDPAAYVAHARLAALSGRAPRRATDLDEALELADRHPYDPRALVDAGRQLADAGRTDEAIPPLETALVFADRDPEAARDAVVLLATLSPEWEERRVVPVHVYADARLRADPGWRFRLRALWLEVSSNLEPLLGIRFLVVTTDGFDAERAGPELGAILGALGARTRRGPAWGMIAGFTAVPAPPLRRIEFGLAHYLERHLVVRMHPKADPLLVLAHEIIHLFGGIHVVDELESLMNVYSMVPRLDAANARIAQALRGRTFGPGSVERNVVPRVDVDEVIESLEYGLAVNLTYRKLGLERLLRDETLSRYHAAREAERVTTLDPHLGDVASFLAALLWHDGRRVQAVHFLEVAARLHGAQTARGRHIQVQAEGLRRRLKAEYDME